MLTFDSLQAKGGSDGPQVVFHYLDSFWAFLTFQYIWFLFANYNIAQWYATYQMPPTFCPIKISTILYHWLPSGLYIGHSLIRDI